MKIRIEWTHVTSTERAPSGVTRLAGAKAYAAKLQASPIPTRRRSENGEQKYSYW